MTESIYRSVINVTFWVPWIDLPDSVSNLAVKSELKVSSAELIVSWNYVNATCTITAVCTNACNLRLETCECNQ